MDNKGDFFGQTMNDIVFDHRNKSYGAYFLRETYKKHLLKAISISISVFVFSLYSPKIVKAIGLFKDKPIEIIDTTTITLSEPPSIKPDEPPPPPPEVEVQRPTEKFMEMLAVKKEEAEDPPPTIEELKDKDIGTEKVEGTLTDEPPPIVQDVVGEVLDEKIYVDVDQKAQFIGGDEAMKEFLHDNLVYPEAEKLYEISGETIVSFVVTIDGKVEDVKVSRSSGNAKLDAEAVRVIRKTTSRFKPGKINGKAVKSQCRIPITFELEDE